MTEDWTKTIDVRVMPPEVAPLVARIEATGAEVLVLEGFQGVTLKIKGEEGIDGGEIEQIAHSWADENEKELGG